MEPVDNNQFEVIPNANTKRKLPVSCSNVFLNPALDLLANEDPMCNNKMEVIPNKKRKRTRSCDIASFENTALDVGISKAAVNEFLKRELHNVWKTVKPTESRIKGSHDCINQDTEPIYDNLNSSDPCLALPRDPFGSSLTQEIGIPTNDMDISIDTDSESEQKSLNPSITFNEISPVEPVNNTSTTNITNHIFINKQTNLSLSFIDRLTADSTNMSNQSLYLDDDLNESNIMEIKTITIITKKKRVSSNSQKKNTNPFLSDSLEAEDITDAPALNENPFIYDTNFKEEYNETHSQVTQRMPNELIPRRLFINDGNSTISTVNEGNYSYQTQNEEIYSNPSQNEYENIGSLRAESPIYENIGDGSIYSDNYNKQSKILGHDVSHFNAKDIMNLNKMSKNNDSNDSKKDFAHKFLKAGKLSKKVFKKIKQTFKHDKVEPDLTLNPYEVPRKPPKVIKVKEEFGIENPGLNLDNSDEIEMEELDEEHQYETVKTLRNTQLNMNVTPLQEIVENFDISQKTTPGRKTVRFDSTLNQEKVITGDSFDYDMASPGFDAKLERYHDELENCINERKFIQQNM